MAGKDDSKMSGHGPLTTETIRHAFRGDIIGREYFCFDSVTSTNDRAIEIGRQREHPEGIVVVANSQTRGRGRLGRNWISPPDVNLYFTVLFSPDIPADRKPLITLAASVAAAAAVRRLTGLTASIKWPNDILVNGRKAGGILTEVKSGKGGGDLLALGIGLNVNMSADDLPQDLKQSSTSLMEECGGPVDRTALLGGVLSELERAYKILLIGDKRALINEWLHLNSTIGNNVMIKTQAGVFSGTAEGINDSGELIVKPASGETRTVNAGDVTIVKSGVLE